MLWTTSEQIASVLRAMSDARDEALRARGEHIAELRKAKGWEQDDLAHEIGVSVSTVSRWERGRHAGYPENHRNLAKALGVPVAEIAPPSEEAPSLLDQLDRIEQRVDDIYALLTGSDGTSAGTVAAVAARLAAAAPSLPEKAPGRPQTRPGEKQRKSA